MLNRRCLLSDLIAAIPGTGMRRVKAVFIGSAGNLIEYYDFHAYEASPFT
jgi:hypothetical protein